MLVTERTDEAGDEARGGAVCAVKGAMLVVGASGRVLLGAIPCLGGLAAVGMSGGGGGGGIMARAGERSERCEAGEPVCSDVAPTAGVKGRRMRLDGDDGADHRPIGDSRGAVAGEATV